MNKKKLLLTLAIGMLLGGCKNKQSSEKTVYEGADTVLVIGVWNQPGIVGLFPRKAFLMVDKSGTRYTYTPNLYKNNELCDVSYVQRGDTVYIEKGQIVKNLTMERMAQRYANGR